MAKSLRSKPKLRAKSIKRNNEFATFVNDRDQRLADKMKANLEKQKAEKAAESAAKAEPAKNAEAPTDAMDEDRKEPEESKFQKIDFMSISTAGGKNRSKKDKNAKSKKNKRARARANVLKF